MPILINDIVSPNVGGMPPFLQHRLRQVDIMMMVALGAKQQTEEEFRFLSTHADPRYRVSTSPILEIALILIRLRLFKI